MKNLFKQIVFVAIRFVVKDIVLRFDRRVIKRYTGLETPLYKMWWVAHSKMLQRKLDKSARQYVFCDGCTWLQDTNN